MSGECPHTDTGITPSGIEICPWCVSKELGEQRAEIARLTAELGAAREDAMSWVREVTGRDSDIDRLTAERDEAVANGQEVAARLLRRDDELRSAWAERDSTLAALQRYSVSVLKLVDERDAALALLQRSLAPIDFAIEHQSPDEITGWCDLWDEIDALQKERGSNDQR